MLMKKKNIEIPLNSVKRGIDSFLYS